MMDIRPMNPEDLDYILANPLEPGVSSIKDITIDGPAFSAWNGSQLVGIGGVKQLWDGVGEAWVLFSKNISSCKFGIYRATKAILNRHYTYHRIQAVVRADFPLGWRMVERLGFKLEGLLEKYGPDGSDYYMYTKVN